MKRNPTTDVIRVEVTPSMAAEWLQANVKNRNLARGAVATFAADMAAGNWRWTGETVKFDANGHLIDGQHRLAAIVQSAATVPMLVIRGLDPEAQEDIDRGRRRSFADILTLRGETNCTALAAVTRQVHRWNGGSHAYKVGGDEYPASASELLATLDKHPELREIATRAKAARRCGIPTAVVGLLMWVFDGLDATDSDYFFAHLTDGTELKAEDPIYVLRRTIERMRSTHHRVSGTMLMAVTIKAWNAYRLGETVKVLRWAPGGANPEKFPEPI